MGPICALLRVLALSEKRPSFAAWLYLCHLLYWEQGWERKAADFSVWDKDWWGSCER